MLHHRFKLGSKARQISTQKLLFYHQQTANAKVNKTMLSWAVSLARKLWLIASPCSCDIAAISYHLPMLHDDISGTSKRKIASVHKLLIVIDWISCQQIVQRSVDPVSLKLLTYFITKQSNEFRGDPHYITLNPKKTFERLLKETLKLSCINAVKRQYFINLQKQRLKRRRQRVKCDSLF